ncbi:hypothetical protein ABC347_01455 [Sphingomonas sp. 1P06PA]|uniref:hypothetical protein n=1 Tax=Sphingomonas sp. 1P06PA TaxID=554121 RepID=UPI0039A5F53D
MGPGAKGAQSLGDLIAAGRSEQAEPEGPPMVDSQLFEEELPPRRRGMLALAVLLGVVAIGWVLFATYVAVTRLPGGTDPLLDLFSLMPVIAAPIAVIGIAYLLIARTSRRESLRFAATAEAMRAESMRLEAVVASLSDRLAAERESLGDHGDRLLALGEEAGGRLAAVSAGFAQEGAILARHSDSLARAASAARADMGVLMTDLPRAEEQLRTMTGQLREAGLGAHEQAAALDAQLIALVARGREAEDAAGGAAQRLAAHAARLEGAGESAGRRIEEAGARLSESADAALDAAGRAIDGVRTGIDAQAAALMAMIDQAQSGFESAGSEAARSLGRRLAEAGQQVDHLSAQLAAQDAASHALLSRLGRGLVEIEQLLATMESAGIQRTNMLSDAVGALRGQAERARLAIEDGTGSADTLIARAEALRDRIDASARTLVEDLPPLLLDIENQAARGAQHVSSATTDAAKLALSAHAIAARFDESRGALAAQHDTLAGLSDMLAGHLSTVETRTQALKQLNDETGEAARIAAEAAGGQLVEALLRVRETATQASERAREALAGVIPEAAEALGAATSDAMRAAMGDRVEGQMREIGEAAERAVSAAQAASDRLMRQMLTIADTTAQVEDRIAEARAEAAEHDEDNLARRVALLIESLNSTAIDVTKLLSNDVTDTAWSAYLKGDRGVFTRRAVRLLDTAEVREIVRHYEDEPEFRDQVNRYIHDFELMLRRILASRDGHALGVTLLSSDMGKLYVALAQAIERLRA